MRYFITYGDNNFVQAKKKIVKEAYQTGEFDEVVAYGREDLSKELLCTNIINIPRGGGLWTWKADVIWSTMQRANNGDIIVYCDSGCSLQKTNDWNWYWKKLKSYDLIAQRILTRNDQVTRKELIQKYIDFNGQDWPYCYQYQATAVILLVSEFTRMFIKEWREIMLFQPQLVMDVTPQERSSQHSTLIENRHDQAVYSALIYKYSNNTEFNKKIYTCWDRMEGCTLLGKQAIRATRLRQGEVEKRSQRLRGCFKRVIKSAIIIPFYKGPLQWWYSRNKK